MLLVFFLQFIVIPLELAIMRNVKLENRSAWTTFRLTLDIACLIDVALNFITGYIDHDAKDVVLVPKKIFMYVTPERATVSNELPNHNF